MAWRTAEYQRGFQAGKEEAYKEMIQLQRRMDRLERLGHLTMHHVKLC